MSDPVARLLDSINKKYEDEKSNPAQDNFDPNAFLANFGLDKPSPVNYNWLKDIDYIPKGSGHAARNRNPGNLQYNGRFIQYDSVKEGWEALLNDIELKKAGKSKHKVDGDSNLYQFFRVYAPPHENNTVAYARYVAKNLGVSLATQIKNIPTHLLAEAIAMYEDRPYWEAISKNKPPTEKVESRPVMNASIVPLQTGRDLTRPETEVEKEQTPIDLMAAPKDQVVRTPEDRNRLPKQPGILDKKPGEGRRAWMERRDSILTKNPAMYGPTPALDGGSVGPTTRKASQQTEVELSVPFKIDRALEQLKFLNPNATNPFEFIISSAQEGGIDFGRGYKAIKQMAAPAKEKLDEGDIGGAALDLFVKTPVGIVYGLADATLGTSGRLTYDGIIETIAKFMPEEEGKKFLYQYEFLTPEQEKKDIATLLATGAAIAVGGAARNVFMNRVIGGLEVGAKATTSELVAALTRPIKKGPVELLKQIGVEGAAGGLTQGVVEEMVTGGDKPLDKGMEYLLPGVILGGAFELALGSKFRTNSDLFRREQAKLNFITRVMELDAESTPAQAISRIHQFDKAKDFTWWAARSLKADGSIGIIPNTKRSQLPPEFLKDGEFFDWVTTHERPDGTTDILIARPAKGRESLEIKALHEDPVRAKGFINSTRNEITRYLNKLRSVVVKRRPDLLDKIKRAQDILDEGAPTAEDLARATVESEEILSRLHQDEVSALKQELDQVINELSTITEEGLTPIQRSTFAQTGFWIGEKVRWLGKEYEFVTAKLDKDGGIAEYHFKDETGKRVVRTSVTDIEHVTSPVVRNPLLTTEASLKKYYELFKKGARELFDEKGNIRTDMMVGPIKTKSLFSRFVIDNNVPLGDHQPVAQYLQAQLAKELTYGSLEGKELAMYQRMVREFDALVPKRDPNLAELADSHGLIPENVNGTIIVRDTDGNIVPGGRFNSVKQAKEFIIRSGAKKTPQLDIGMFPTVANDMGFTHQFFMPELTDRPWTPDPDGIAREAANSFNTSGTGNMFTSFMQVMRGWDAKYGTTLVEKVWYPLYSAFKAKHAAMYPDAIRVAEFAKYITDNNLTAEQVNHLVRYVETRNPSQIRNGELLGRALNADELGYADWFIRRNADMEKAFDWLREIKTLEEKYGAYATKMIKDAERKGKITPEVDEAARKIGEILSNHNPADVSMYGITRLVNSVLGDELSPADYAAKEGLSQTVLDGAKMMEDNFRYWADKFNIPEERRLQGYFTHKRPKQQYVGKPNIDAIIEGKEFQSAKVRTGEIADYNRNPIEVMLGYLNSAYDDIYVRQPWDAAVKYIDAMQNVDPKQKAMAQKVLHDYMYELKGVPNAERILTEGAWHSTLDRLGISSDPEFTTRVVNNVLLFLNTKFIGARPMQGVRDALNVVQIYYSMFGVERTKNMLEMITKYTPEDLVKEGILKESRVGESTIDAMSREGIFPELSPVQTRTAIETLLMKTQDFTPGQNFWNKLEQKNAAIADIGMNLSLQHSSYRWGHAATYLESYTNTMRELNKFVFEESRGQSMIAAREKIYKKLKLNSYDLPVINYFDKLVVAGKFQEAAKFLATVTSVDVNAVLGMGHSPTAWRGSLGRMWGQFGNWPTQIRSTITRLGTRGSVKDRAAALSRFAMTQAAISAVGVATHTSLNGWLLPYAAGFDNALKSFYNGFNPEDEDKDYDPAQLGLGMLQLTLGTGAGTLYKGGPLISLWEDMQAVADATRANDALAWKDLISNWMLGGPVPFALKDYAGAAELMSQGFSPLRALAKGLGITSDREYIRENSDVEN